MKEPIILDKFMNSNNIIFAIVGGLIGFWFATAVSFPGNDLTEDKLDTFFRNHTVSGKHAVAIKKRLTSSQSETSYLGTIHGYPNNLSVCEELIAPYNEDSSPSVVSGTYYCEVLSPR